MGLLPVHVLGDLGASEVNLLLGDSLNRNLELHVRQQIGEGLLLGLMTDRQLGEVKAHQPVVKHDEVG